jgi:hypothetical protein
VAGVHHRKENAVSFARAVEKAEAKGLLYGVHLEPEPTNTHDPKAIKVIGYAEKKTLFGKEKRAEWHIGYLERDDAADLHKDLVSQGLSISAVLYRVFALPNFAQVGFDLIALAPPGHSLSVRRRRK